MQESPKIADFANEEFCYLTTRGRVSGLPREVEIWFGVIGSTLYMLSGNRDKSDWVRNILKEPKVTVRIKGHVFTGDSHVIDSAGDEDALARKLLVDKYQTVYEGDLTSWGKTSLPVAVDFHH